MANNQGFESLRDLFQENQSGKTPPAYQWQELALKVIKELNIPDKKRSSVFKACKQNSKIYIENCLNDTKELCESKEKWRYFFKIVNEGRNSKN